MLKKVLCNILIVFGLVALWASTSRTAMHYIADHRNVIAWWGIYPTNRGDIMGWTYLDFVKVLNPPPVNTKIKRAAAKEQKGNTVLYLFGDSYSYELADSAFSGLVGYYPMSRYFDNYIHPDTSRKNILVLEFGERFVRGSFDDLGILNKLKDTVAGKKTVSRLGNRESRYYASVFPAPEIDDFFNKNINQNLQYNLFNYDFISPLFKSKAALNFYLFNRTSTNGAVISDDGKYLFFYPTVDPHVNTSSYSPVDEQTITLLTNNLNKIYDHYKSLGFTEVYLSIIPNTATIVQPRGYNNLIPRIQNDPRLRIKVIDMYTPFKNSKVEVYKHADTHWNMTGKQMWVNEINNIISVTNNSKNK